MTVKVNGIPPKPADTTYDITGLTQAQALKLHALLGRVHVKAGFSDLFDALDRALGEPHIFRYTIEAEGKYDSSRNVTIKGCSVLRVMDNEGV